MKFFILCIVLFVFGGSFAQKVDTIINTGIYKSYFSYKSKEPLYVSYKIYHAGGSCDRSKFHFKNDISGLKAATQNDYNGCGYDEGHLANAADFSNDCVSDEKTFRFYNCLPQTPNLNRGIWKRYETDLRKISQTDSLYIVCGGIFSDTSKTIGPSRALVPDYCWKVVIDLTKRQMIYSLIFTNTNHASVDSISFPDLEKLTKFSIPIPKY